MHNNKSTIKIINGVYRQLNFRRKVQLGMLGIMIIIASLLEAMSIGSLLPFLGALTAPERISEIRVFKEFLKYFDMYDVQRIQLTFTLLFTSLVLISTIFKLLFFWLMTRWSMAIGLDFSVRVFKRILYQPYIEIISMNSSEILSVAQKAKDLAGNVINPTLILISSAFMIIAIFITLLIVEPIVAISGTFGLIGLYCMAVFITKKRLSQNSNLYSVYIGRVNKSILEGIGGIRDVIIDQTQEIFSRNYASALANMQLAASSNLLLSQLPKYLIEAIGIIILSSLFYLMIISGKDMIIIIPILGVTAMCVQKMLPVLQQAYAAFVTIKGSSDSVQDVLDILDKSNHYGKEPSRSGAISFENSISLTDITFNYPSDQRQILQKVSFEIKKGEKVGIVGATGSGKSTLIDIIMGLLKPSSGTIKVDGQILTDNNIKEWHSFISHVPQHIFLTDGTILENIAFGVEPYAVNIKRVYDVVQACQLTETINRLPNGLETIVGERGIRLSGGQRQRLGIARALYKKSKLLILDEATSALDSKTEEMVINSIQQLGSDLTILLITHREASLSICSRIIDISNRDFLMQNN